MRTINTVLGWVLGFEPRASGITIQNRYTFPLFYTRLGFIKRAKVRRRCAHIRDTKEDTPALNFPGSAA